MAEFVALVIDNLVIVCGYRGGAELVPSVAICVVILLLSHLPLLAIA